jgi:hypothetical protein
MSRPLAVLILALALVLLFPAWVLVVSICLLNAGLPRIKALNEPWVPV